MSVNKIFEWKCHPEAEAFVLEIIHQASLANPEISRFGQLFQEKASVRLIDLVDHLVLGYSKEIEDQLLTIGYQQESASLDFRVFHHPGAQLPKILIKDLTTHTSGVAITVESIENFLMAHSLSNKIEGSPLSGFRRCHLSTDQGVSLWVIERRGTLTMDPTYESKEYLNLIIQCKEKWNTRPRDLEDDETAIERATSLAKELASNLGTPLAAWLVLACEREYWQMRNLAGQYQKMRQDQVGIGWANQDHHTFRSSRAFFTQLVRIFEILGFHCRERFYAGQEAGWGAQVMENPQAKLVLFLDVDLAPNEIEIDFAHHPLPQRNTLGTIGLWCGLHGDSILQAGMHHLEGQFFFEALKEHLSTQGISMMPPFSTFSYLKQAFTQGQLWPVNPKRLKKLFELKLITAKQLQTFKEKGALGSHLENLQRREGYKGFNQKNVSFIIKETDPRTPIKNT